LSPSIAAAAAVAFDDVAAVKTDDDDDYDDDGNNDAFNATLRGVTDDDGGATADADVAATNDWLLCL